MTRAYEWGRIYEKWDGTLMSTVRTADTRGCVGAGSVQHLTGVEDHVETIDHQTRNTCTILIQVDHELVVDFSVYII